MIRASQILFWFGLSIAASIALYNTSDRARELDRQLHKVHAAIEAEKQNIHVLNAEWMFLSNPARINGLAKKYLTALRPSEPRQVIEMASLDDAAPTKQQAMASVDVTTPPIATVKTSLAVRAPARKPAPKAARAADAGHINNRMVMQHTASAQPIDPIGALINGLGSRP
ncbi:MAG: hypothetical protein AB7H77_01040 [Bdellovibrionales bacterium]